MGMESIPAFFRVVITFLSILLFPGARMFRKINSKPDIFTLVAYHPMNLAVDDWFNEAEMMLEALRLNLNIGAVSAVNYLR